MAHIERISIFNQRYRKQILATLTVHILTLVHGISHGWVSPTLLILQSPQSPLDFTVSADNVSWIGSIFGIGSLCGNIAMLYTLNRFSRKLNLCVLALPHMLFWICDYFAQSVEYLYAARFCSGFTGGGLYVASPIFVGEIAETNIRGALTTMAMMFLSCGILIGFILPSYLDYHLIPCIVVALTCLYVCAMACFPETPTGLLQRRQEDHAKASFDFYRNNKCESMAESESGPSKPTAADTEFDKLKASILTGDKKTPVTIGDFLNKSALQKFALAFVVILQNQCSSSFAITNYMGHIFEESGSTMDAKHCTIYVGFVQIVGTFLASILVERFGRKVLVLLSSIGMAIGMFGLGAFVQLTSDAIKLEYDWVPLAAMAFIVASASIGVISLTFTIIVEILPAKIRSEAQSITMMWCSIWIFITLKLYPYFLFNYGISITMYTCASCCVITCTYLLLFLPETKGKSIAED